MSICSVDIMPNHFITDTSPSLQDSLTTPIVSTEGRSILLTCVVRELGNRTLLWKYGTQKVLTAGTVRITPDTRFSVLHDKGTQKSIQVSILFSSACMYFKYRWRCICIANQ